MKATGTSLETEKYIYMLKVFFTHMSIIMTCIMQIKPSEVTSSLQVTMNKLVKSWILGEVESHFGFWPLFVCFLSLSNVNCLFLRLYPWFSPFGCRISHILSVLSQDPTVTEQKLCTLNYRKVICSCTLMVSLLSPTL